MAHMIGSSWRFRLRRWLDGAVRAIGNDTGGGKDEDETPGANFILQREAGDGITLDIVSRFKHFGFPEFMRCCRSF